MRTNDVVMFEEVWSIVSNDIREGCQVVCWIELQDEKRSHSIHGFGVCEPDIQ